MRAWSRTDGRAGELVNRFLGRVLKCICENRVEGAVAFGIEVDGEPRLVANIGYDEVWVSRNSVTVYTLVDPI